VIVFVFLRGCGQELLSITDTLFSIFHTESLINSTRIFSGKRSSGTGVANRLYLKGKTVKSMPDMEFLKSGQRRRGRAAHVGPAGKRAKSAIYGLTRKLGCNPFIWRLY